MMLDFTIPPLALESSTSATMNIQVHQPGAHEGAKSWRGGPKSPGGLKVPNEASELLPQDGLVNAGKSSNGCAGQNALVATIN
jgi:hypothetical protein